MPSVQENWQRWNNQLEWSENRDNWSSGWGGPDMQWFASILPRIHLFLPTPHILEIAPGNGRWTQFLLQHCDRLSIVDLAEKCINDCREYFKDFNHIEYHVNDGKSLEMIEKDSVDFVFSYDSMVHVEADVIEAYLVQLSKIMKPEGVGFIHHSNIGMYLELYSLAKTVEGASKILKENGLFNTAWRAPSMTAEIFRKIADYAGFSCLSQELINWSNRDQKWLIDCFTLFTKKGSSWERPLIVKENPEFMNEVTFVRGKSELYGAKSFPGPLKQSS